jgi:hypothetical protein
VLIGPGERYDLVFTATNPGLWLFHCHVVPHVTNDGAYPGGLLVPVVTEAKKPARGKRARLSLHRRPRSIRQVTLRISLAAIGSFRLLLISGAENRES